MKTGSAEDQVLLAACQFIQVDIVCGSYIRECLKEHEKTEMILQIIGTWWNNITPEIIGTWWNNITPETQVQRLWAAGNNKEKYKY